jgi:hypothetical protein
LIEGTVEKRMGRGKMVVVLGRKTVIARLERQWTTFKRIAAETSDRNTYYLQHKAHMVLVGIIYINSTNVAVPKATEGCALNFKYAKNVG